MIQRRILADHSGRSSRRSSLRLRRQSGAASFLSLLFRHSLLSLRLLESTPTQEAFVVKALTRCSRSTPPWPPSYAQQGQEKKFRWAETGWVTVTHYSMNCDVIVNIKRLKRSVLIDFFSSPMVYKGQVLHPRAAIQPANDRRRNLKHCPEKKDNLSFCSRSKNRK